MLELSQTGRVPQGYQLHVLNNRGGLHNGSMDFHLSNGKIDVVVIYKMQKNNPVILLVRIGTHKELFQGKKE